MAEKKTSKKPAASRKTTVKAAAAKKTTATKVKATSTVSAGSFASANGSVLKLGALKPAAGSRPKRQRIGRGHGSGMVKTGGEGGKGQTVRSGGGKGPAFEGGQTPWARRLPHKRGYSQKARDLGHFRSRLAVVNLHRLAEWDASVEVSPESLKEKGILKSALDGVKILGGAKTGKTLPSGLRFRDVQFSNSAREALSAAGAQLGESAE
ncbi:MAG: 50S ribosomal protein L15 [Candidatus Eremiobacteraeota bacterium]|nr:50S ribosomal protein L15 [Candidatus Eremiobacteraeota bacterium]MBV8284511.1 50S ribosomal protein L15 [Candidatus Eremiobacteraeota bacterium]MBV8582359.1 50S ribosomal protein L15 [Candidatus Eremiobacteraeota bacterium]